MTKIFLTLDSLERVVSAPDQRQLVEAALAAFKEISAGDFYSAIQFDLQTLATEVFFPDQGWLKSQSPVLNAIQTKLTEHPLTRTFLADRQPIVLLRSQVVPNQTWRHSTIYNEVDRPLGIEDMATVYQITASNQVLVLSCGRSRQFSDRDLAPIRSFHRVLNGLDPFRSGAQKPHCSQPDSRHWGKVQGSLAALTTREREILHWVRAGKRDAEIGIILGISPRTVHHHLQKIYFKLDVETRTAAAFVQ